MEKEKEEEYRDEKLHTLRRNCSERVAPSTGWAREHKKSHEDITHTHAHFIFCSHLGG